MEDAKSGRVTQASLPLLEQKRIRGDAPMHWHSVSLSGLEQRTQRPKVSGDCSGSAGVKAEPEEMQRNGQLRMWRILIGRVQLMRLTS
jgi:hypothetical protein